MAGADPSLPLWTFVFLVALGTDYNIFLMTRVHEESGRWGTRRGALIGLAATGGVITSAGVVLAGVVLAGTFAALGTLPLVFVTELGFAVAFGVLLDTFVVRSVLVTALNLDVGRRIWWPSRLACTEDVALDQLVQEEPAALTRWPGSNCRVEIGHVLAGPGRRWRVYPPACTYANLRHA